MTIWHIPILPCQLYLFGHFIKLWLNRVFGKIYFIQNDKANISFPNIAKLFALHELSLSISLTAYMFHVEDYLLWPKLGHYLLGYQLVDILHIKAKLLPFRPGNKICLMCAIKMSPKANPIVTTLVTRRPSLFRNF